MSDPCRRRIEDWETPLLLALGAELRAMRLQAHLTQWELAGRAELRARSLGRIERGERRTRLSTLARIAQGLEPDDPEAAQALLRALLDRAGPALAAEGPHRERVDARRARRERRARWNPWPGRKEDIVDFRYPRPGVVLERHTLRRWVTRGTIRETVWTEQVEHRADGEVRVRRPTLDW